MYGASPEGRRCRYGTSDPGWNAFPPPPCSYRVHIVRVREENMTGGWRRCDTVLSRCYYGRWRSLHAERRCEREWTRCISIRQKRHEKLNMFNFSGGSPRSSRITADEWRMSGDWIRCIHVPRRSMAEYRTAMNRRCVNGALVEIKWSRS